MRIDDGQKLWLTLMVIALELVVIFAAGMFGYFGYALLCAASVFTYVLTCEGLYLHAFISYAAVSIIGFLIVPDKATAIAFAGLFGHYPLFKTAADAKLQNRAAAFCVKLLYCNVWLIAALCVVIFILKISLPTDLPLPMWAVVCLVEAALCITELIHTFCRWLYSEKLRSGIVPKN